MTLVVARILHDAVCMSGDLRATDVHGIKSGYQHGILKVVTLSPSVCVGFAGDVDLALDGLAIAAAGPLEPDRVIERLRNLIDGLRHTAAAPEYLVASLQPPRIARLRPGEPTEDGIVTGWIGDQAAFNEFQSLAGPRPRPPWPPSVSVHAILANWTAVDMDKVVESAAAPTVGEAVVAIQSTSAGVFRYMQITKFEMTTMSSPTPGVPMTMRHGTAAEGASGYTVMPRVEPGPGAVGLHFQQGALGLLYHPLHRREPIVYRDVTTPEQFTAAVHRDFGFTLAGLPLYG